MNGLRCDSTSTVHPGWATSDEIEFAMGFFMPESRNATGLAQKAKGNSTKAKGKVAEAARATLNELHPGFTLVRDIVDTHTHQLGLTAITLTLTSPTTTRHASVAAHVPPCVDMISSRTTNLTGIHTFHHLDAMLDDVLRIYNF